MLFALPYLRRRGFAANAHGCRQFPEALALIRALRHAHRLPRLVVIALGADGVVTRGDIRSTLRVLGHRRRLVLVTALETGGRQGSDARLVRRSDQLYPGRINVLDWVHHSRGHGNWFQPDGLHLTFTGAAAFARFLARARPLALGTPTAFGSLPFAKPSGRSRVTATLRLRPLASWRVMVSRSPAGAPGFVVRRRGRCATDVTLRSVGRRLPAAVDATARLAALTPRGATIDRRGRAGSARYEVWRTAAGTVGGAWTLPLGDPFPRDRDRAERGYLDVVAAARPLGSAAQTCAQETAARVLARLRRLTT